MKLRCKQSRCRTEREILTLMKHPNIVRCFGTFRTEKFLYFIMEFATPFLSLPLALIPPLTLPAGTALAPSFTSF
jgi:hypothetical protein